MQPVPFPPTLEEVRAYRMYSVSLGVRRRNLPIASGLTSDQETLADLAAQAVQMAAVFDQFPSRALGVNPALPQAVAQEVQQAIGPALDQALGPALQQALGPALDQTLGPALQRALGPAVEQAVGVVVQPLRQTTQALQASVAALQADVATLLQLAEEASILAAKSWNGQMDQGPFVPVKTPAFQHLTDIGLPAITSVAQLEALDGPVLTDICRAYHPVVPHRMVNRHRMILSAIGAHYLP